MANDWFYNSNDGSIIEEPSWLSWGQTTVANFFGQDWHGPFPSKQAAISYYTSNSAKNPGWKAPTGVAGNLVNEGANAAGAASALTGINAIGDAFQRLTQASFWERAGQVVLGLILIAMGVAHITHAVPIATKIARTAGSAVAVAA